MKAGELRQLSTDELEHKLLSLKEELFKLRFQAKSGKIEKPSRIREAKRDIARILTIRRESQTKDERRETKDEGRNRPSSQRAKS